MIQGEEISMEWVHEEIHGRIWCCRWRLECGCWLCGAGSFAWGSVAAAAAQLGWMGGV